MCAGVRLVATLAACTAGTPEELLDALGRADHVVGPELEDRRLLGPDLAGDRRLQAHPVLAEGVDDVAVAVLTGERVEEDDRPVELRVDVDLVTVTNSSGSSSMRTSSSAMISRNVSRRGPSAGTGVPARPALEDRRARAAMSFCPIDRW